MHPARRLFVDRSPPAVRPQQALRRLRSRSLAVGQGEAPFPRALQQPCKAHEVTVRFGAGAATRTVAHYRPSCYLRLWIDRKSVVEGKRVSVSVELGGRRVIKKKTKK